MIDDIQLVEAAQRAERIKAAMPQLPVSTDAIFTVIALDRRKRKRSARLVTPTTPDDPPAWFIEAVTDMKGQSVTVSNFALRAGQFPSSAKEIAAIGRWLRASGRKPRKSSGKQVFDI